MHPIVSFADEPLILVDDHDTVVGYAPKDACHRGSGLLHRAFSLFVFNGSGKVLLHQRSAQKTLWPHHWTNSCCSHPRRGETLEGAAQRRLQEELGLSAPLTLLYRFVYQARFSDLGAEHELCAVFVGRSDAQVTVNDNEIAAWEFVDVEALAPAIAAHPEKYTPWFKLEWQRLRADHWPAIASLISAPDPDDEKR